MLNMYYPNTKTVARLRQKKTISKNNLTKETLDFLKIYKEESMKNIHLVHESFLKDRVSKNIEDIAEIISEKESEEKK